MIELRQIYKCNVCGNLVEVLHAGVGTKNIINIGLLKL